MKTQVVPESFFQEELDKAKEALAGGGVKSASIDDLIDRILEAVEANDPSSLMSVTYTGGMDDETLTGQQIQHSISLSELKKREAPINWALSPWPKDQPKNFTRRESTIIVEQVYYLEPTFMFWIEDTDPKASLFFFPIGEKDGHYYIAGVNRSIKPRRR